MGDLPHDWFEEHDGQRLVLNPEKVAAEIDRLRKALQDIVALHTCGKNGSLLCETARAALTNGEL